MNTLQAAGKVVPLMELADLQRLLEPLVPRFQRAIWPVMDQYDDLPPEQRVQFDRITRASILNDYMETNLKREFLDLEGKGVRFIAGPNASFNLGIDGLSFGVDGTVLVRPKKLDEKNKSRNMHTKRVDRIERNEALEGFPEATWVNLGYVLNPLETAIRAVHLVRIADNAPILEMPRQADGPIVMRRHLSEVADEPRFVIDVNRRNEKDEN